MHFIYAKIPLLDGIAEQLPRWHDEIERGLAAHTLGSLVSWGTSVANGAVPGADRHHRLDIELSDQAPGLRLLQRVLVGLGCPVGTALHYTEAGAAMQLLLREAGWSEPQLSGPSRRPARRGT